MLFLTISQARKRLISTRGVPWSKTLRQKSGFLQSAKETNNKLMLQEINPDQWWKILGFSSTIVPTSPAISADVANLPAAWLDHTPSHKVWISVSKSLQSTVGYYPNHKCWVSSMELEPTICWLFPVYSKEELCLLQQHMYNERNWYLANNLKPQNLRVELFLSKFGSQPCYTDVCYTKCDKERENYLLAISCFPKFSPYSQCVLIGHLPHFTEYLQREE